MPPLRATSLGCVTPLLMGFCSLGRPLAISLISTSGSGITVRLGSVTTLVAASEGFEAGVTGEKPTKTKTDGRPRLKVPHARWPNEATLGARLKAPSNCRNVHRIRYSLKHPETPQFFCRMSPRFHRAS